MPLLRLHIDGNRRPRRHAMIANYCLQSRRCHIVYDDERVLLLRYDDANASYVG